MTDQVIPIPAIDPAQQKARLKGRHAAEKRFRMYGLAAIGFAAMVLVLLVGSIAIQAWPAFFETRVNMQITFSEEKLDPNGIIREGLVQDPSSEAYDTAIRAARGADYRALYRDQLKVLFPEETSSRSSRRMVYELISDQNQFVLMNMVIDNPSLIGTTQDMWLMAHTNMDVYNKGLIDMTTPEEQRRVKDFHAELFERLRDVGKVNLGFAWQFFTNGASLSPESAGVWGAIVGSFWTLVVTLAVSFPIAVLSAVYLEEFAPKNKITELIEVNINNLAAVPSIVFGLLGQAVFINMMDLPRSAPLVGGLTLALMTLPTIIIATRAALKAVPPSIKDAALGLGASKTQAMFHHTLPLALPGILTGTIIGMAQALGETAPLLMIGMVAFVQELPTSPTDPASVLPVQVYLWSDSPQRAFTNKTSAAIMVLLVFLISMNMLAVALRKRFERRW